MAQPSVDVLIIGGGPGGLAAALALGRQLFRAKLFDSGSYRNARSHHMHTTPTWDHRDSIEYRAAAREEIETRYNNTQFIGQNVTSIRKLDDGFFEATDATGKAHTGRKVILASGVRDVYPDIKGYDEAWGRSV